MWVIKLHGEYWSGATKSPANGWDPAQRRAVRFPVYSVADDISAQLGGKAIKLVPPSMPLCPACQTNTLVTKRSGNGRDRRMGSCASSHSMRTLRIPDSIRIPECGRCFRMIITPNVRRQLRFVEEAVVRRTMPLYGIVE